MGLKLNYQFDEEPIDTYISSKHKNSEDNELPAKKLKLNDKKIAILEYSSVQLPLAPFIDFIEKYLKTFEDQCLTHNNSNETTD